MQARYMPKIEQYPVTIHFEWYRGNAKSDPDNVDFARKFILDGLVEAGILRNDTCREIRRLVADVYVSSQPRVVVTIIPVVVK
jgi:Holliday junction resolvase RusA-like endonuclease